jgi:hypothetical protein
MHRAECRQQQAYTTVMCTAAGAYS